MAKLEQSGNKEIEKNRAKKKEPTNRCRHRNSPTNSAAAPDVCVHFVGSMRWLVVQLVVQVAEITNKCCDSDAWSNCRNSIAHFTLIEMTWGHLKYSKDQKLTNIQSRRHCRCVYRHSVSHEYTNKCAHTHEVHLSFSHCKLQSFDSLKFLVSLSCARARLVNFFTRLCKYSVFCFV